MTRRWTTVLVALLAIVSVGLATEVPSGRDSVVGGAASFRSLYLSGPLMFWGTNTESNDTLFAGEVVGFSPTVIQVVDSYAVGSAYDTATILDALNSTLDTVPYVGRIYGSSTPVYDVERFGRFYLQFVLRSASNTDGDTHYVRIHGYDNTGIGHWMQWFYVSTSTAALNVDTILTAYKWTKIDTVYVECSRANDSIAINAVPIMGVKVGTGYATDIDSTAYAGVVQATILPRHSGPVARFGPAYVKVNATSTDIKNGYWLTPSATAGYAAASASMPVLPMGRVTETFQGNAAVMALLCEPTYNGTAAPTTYASPVTFQDSIILSNGGVITNPHADTVKVDEANLLLTGNVKLANGGLIANAHADTVTITEANVKAAGNIVATGTANITGASTLTGGATVGASGTALVKIVALGADSLGFIVSGDTFFAFSGGVK